MLRSMVVADSRAVRGAKSRAWPCLAAAALIAGCVDANKSPDEPLAPIPVLIDTDLAAPPLFAAIRADGDAWTQVPFTNTGRFEIAIAGPYELLYVCSDAGFTWTQLILTTTADGLARTIGCISAAAPTPRVTVTGTVLQPGRVQIGPASAVSTTAPWSFALEVPRSIYDIVVDDGTRVSMQRGVTIDAPVTLPAMDLTGAAELVKTKLRITGVLDDENVSSKLGWITETGVTVLGFEGDVARRLPTEVLAPTDVIVSVAEAHSQRTARSTYLTTPPDVFFPPRLEGIALDDVSARWSSLPPSGEVWLRVSTDTHALLVDATSRWRVGRQAMRADFSAEGYRSEWRVDPMLTRRRELTAYIGDQTSSYGYTVLGQ